MSKNKRFIVIVQQPACSTVLFINGARCATEVTILEQSTHSVCEAFARGYTMGCGLPSVDHRGTVQRDRGHVIDMYLSGESA